MFVTRLLMSKQSRNAISFVRFSFSESVRNQKTPTKSTTFTAKFTKQYQLTMNAGSGGTVTPATGWQASGKVVSITGKPAVNEAFSNWTGSGTGSYSGTNNPASITMNGPITETAAFVQGPAVTVTASPTQIQEGQTATYTISIAQAQSKPVAIPFKMSGTAGQGAGNGLHPEPLRQSHDPGRSNFRLCHAYVSSGRS